jgi:transcriptional regulator with XRE-family HTH domain
MAPTPIARVIRATQKVLGISQLSMARKIGVSQASLSRAEIGELKLSPVVVGRIAELTGTDVLGIHEGIINIAPTGAFELPARYRKREAGSTSRTAFPLGRYIRNTKGHKFYTEMIEHMCIDPDMLVCLGERIPLRLHIDILNELERHITMEDEILKDITSALFLPALHGDHFDKYHGKGPIESILCWMKTAPAYEINYRWSIEQASRNSITISGRPQDHVSGYEFRHSNLACQYRKAFFETIATIQNRNAVICIDEKECWHRRGTRCVYEISTAPELA